MPKSFYSVFFFSLFCSIAATSFGQNTEQSNTPFFLLFPFGYDFIHFDENIIHNPAAGVGFLFGEQDTPFDEVDRKIFALALYRPLIFNKPPLLGIPAYFHQIETLFDGRINRHQFLVIFKSAADKPVIGGLSTFQAGLGWGYEIIRKRQVSLIIGMALGVSDFDIMLPSGNPLPVLPLPLIRFNVDTHWFVSFFDFLSGPNFSFTIAPKERIRLTADMRMDKFRNIDDLIYEYTLWYRLFSVDHKMGDFAVIGAGIKHDMAGFTLSFNAKTFELQQTSVFAAIDLSILKIQSGWIFNSGYLIDGEKHGSPGKGFYVSIQGIIPVNLKK